MFGKEQVTLKTICDIKLATAEKEQATGRLSGWFDATSLNRAANMVPVLTEQATSIESNYSLTPLVLNTETVSPSF